MMDNKMEIIRIILIIIMWVLIIGFGCNFIMQKVSYSFYKGATQMEDVTCAPEFIQITDKLTGYGYNLDANSGKVILFFGGSNYIAYNSVGKYADKFANPFFAVDYYGTQDSKGKMNIHTMEKSATELYDWVQKQYPQSEIIIMGHSYGVGMATYLASERRCNSLVLASGYRDVSDLYNKMIPIFWGPLKVFISNNICTSEYAKSVTCPVYVIGSNEDTTLNASLQKELSNCFENSELKIFNNVTHENYFLNDEVIEYINGVIE